MTRSRAVDRPWNECPLPVSLDLTRRFFERGTSFASGLDGRACGSRARVALGVGLGLSPPGLSLAACSRDSDIQDVKTSASFLATMGAAVDLCSYVGWGVATPREPSLDLGQATPLLLERRVRGREHRRKEAPREQSGSQSGLHFGDLSHTLLTRRAHARVTSDPSYGPGPWLARGERGRRVGWGRVSPLWLHGRAGLKRD